MTRAHVSVSILPALLRAAPQRQAELLQRLRNIRAGVVLDKATYEYWNRMHPDEAPISTAFEDAVIAWCDGKGPLPGLPAAPEGQPHG